MTVDIADTAHGGTAALRAQAAEIVRDIADRLGDIELVRSRTRTPEQAHGPLLDGHAGIALLFAELARHDPAFRPAAHAHLRAAGSALGPARSAFSQGLFTGPAAMGFACRMVSRAGDGYAEARGRIREYTARLVIARAARLLEHARTSAAAPAAEEYDLVHGMTGQAVYLLHETPMETDAVGRAVDSAIALILPRGNDPGATAWAAIPPPGVPNGSFRLGAAHGVSGLLAFLCAAGERGIHRPGQVEATEHLASWFLEHLRNRPPSRPHPDAPSSSASPAGLLPGWCSGASGVSTALYAAGRTLDRPALRTSATDVLCAALDASEGQHNHDTGLCHGWGGLLHVAQRMAADTSDPGLRAATDRMARNVIARHDPDSVFGFQARWSGPDGPVSDDPGLLCGAAGTALALHTYAVHARTKTPWGSAFLVW